MTKHNKPPAFQFYVKDWLSSPNVRAMTLAQRGLYIDLLAYSWPYGIPAGIVGHSLMGMPEAEWKEISPPVLAQFEQKEDGRLVHTKLEDQFKSLDKFHKMQRDKAKKGADARWHNAGADEEVPEDASSSSFPSSSSPSGVSVRNQSKHSEPFNEDETPSATSKLFETEEV
jgi:hypothetical protein